MSFRLSTLLGFLSALNILVIFLYHWYILTVIGPGAETDAFFAATAVPEMFLTVVTAAIPGVLIPFLAVQCREGMQEQSWCLLQAIGGLSSILAILLVSTASFWVPLLVPGFSAAGWKLAISLTRIHLLGMIFTASAAVLWSYWYARKRFIRTEVSVLISALAGLFFLLLTLSKFGIMAAAWSMLIRSSLQFLLLLPGLGPYHRPDFKDRGLLEIRHRLFPLIIGSVYSKTDLLVDRFLASMASTGQLSMLFFARQIYTAGNTILGKALTAPAMPLLAQSAAEGNWALFKQIVRTRVLCLSLITGLFVVGFHLVGKEALTSLFGLGKFNPSEIEILYLLMIALTGLWIGGALGQIFSTCFYAKKDTKTPTVIGVIGFTLGIGFKLGGFYLWGVIGIAAGTSLYYLINAGLLRIFLKIPESR